MALLPLVLSASKSSWQAPMGHGEARANPALHSVISKRFNHTCQYCGWVDEEYNEVSHIDEDHTNNSEENLTLACPLCHQCLHLGHAASAEGGKMIWCPELSQVQLNNLARVYWMTEFEPDHPFLMSSRTMVTKIEHQTHELEAYYIQGASDPGFWAEVLLKLTPEQYAKRGDLLKNIRLWPSIHRFKKMVPKWTKKVTINLPSKEWSRLALSKPFNDVEIE